MTETINNMTEKLANYDEILTDKVNEKAENIYEKISTISHKFNLKIKLNFKYRWHNIRKINLSQS